MLSQVPATSLTSTRDMYSSRTRRRAARLLEHDQLVIELFLYAHVMSLMTIGF